MFGSIILTARCEGKINLRVGLRNIVIAILCLICANNYAANAKDWSGEFVISSTPKIWTNSRGKTVEAVWKYVNEDSSLIWLVYSSNKKTIQMRVDLLSKEDQQYVHDFIATCKQAGLVWWKGAYISSNEYQDLQYIEKATKYIVEKSLVENKDLEVVQVWTYGGLCNYGEYVNKQFFSDRGSKLIYWDEGTKGILANGDILKNKRMYWAGTITYNTVNNRSNTVACYTDDLKWAIHLVRLRMGLHRANDEKFVSKTEHSAKTTKEQSKKSNQPISTGSGFFITKDGFFVTNNHVIEGGRSYKVLTADGLQSAELVQVDPQTDLALMRVKGTFKPIKFSMRKNEKLGASIATMGFPQPGIQGFSPKVTRGVISGETGFKGDVREYQIDASIQPGNSGGPLFNSSGELVGVVVATLRNGQVVNYAIKKAYLLAFLDSALKVSSGIIEGNTTTENFKFEEVVDDIRSSCALVLTYN